MSDITLHVGALVLAAAVLLGAGWYGLAALVALGISLAGGLRRQARRAAGTAGLLALVSLLLAAFALAVPSNGAGDDAADVLLFVWLGLFLAGNGLIVWSAVRGAAP